MEREMDMTYPKIIQGGMGAAISSWLLAKAVSKLGQLGVVSGVALETVFVRRLQLGDPGGHIQRALAHFPYQKITQRIYKQYFIEGGKSPEDLFRRVEMWSLKPSIELQQLTVVANFVEVWLAKEGHNGLIGINYLEKIQLPNLASIYGAMLAGVDYILMGAGIPWEIPGILDKYINHEEASLGINVIGAEKSDDFRIHLNPQEVIGKLDYSLIRPKFLAIIAANVLAISLKKKSTGTVDGFIIEGPTAGGHNAPPRGIMQLNGNGEPLYGEKDVVDLEKISSLELPFWLAGGFGSPQGLKAATSVGAIGIQVGTPFALCKESGLDPKYIQLILQQIEERRLTVSTRPNVSPTGFPFKVVELGDTLSNPNIFGKRARVCNLRYLSTLYRRADGKVRFRCPSEPVSAFTSKGGEEGKTKESVCLCSSLMANAKLGEKEEPCFVTLGSNVDGVLRLIHLYGMNYSAGDVINFLAPEIGH